MKLELSGHPPDEKKSSPSRGTWIEIYYHNLGVKSIAVVPLTGDVD